MNAPAVALEPRRSALRRILIGYLVIVGLLGGGFALAAVAIVAAADRERAAALIEGDLGDTIDKLAGPPALRRDKALAIVMARTALGGERIYRLSEGGVVLAGAPTSLRFHAAGDGYWEANGTNAIARVVTIQPGVELLVGRQLAQGSLTRQLLAVAAMLLLLALLSAAAIGLVVGRRLTARVAAINAACDRVRLGDLGARAPLPPGDDDEFAALAAHVNAMLERIDTLVMGLRDVSNRIAHDLRTPVARLKSDIEMAADARDLRSAREYAGAAAAETDEILQTFEALLDIAEVEAGGAGGLRPMRLDEAAGAAAELYATVAEAAEIALDLELAPAAIIGERMLIVRLAANIIDNAIKFSPAGSAVLVMVAIEQSQAVLRVADHGPGVADGERDLVMTRFARSETTRHVRGHGLGLALVSAVAKRHGASVRMADNAPGLMIEIRFARFAGEAG
ncbi:HAMP domain-containing sensor histidine kinase [Sphingomonas sp. 1P06PA]|uniref:HAMP domain-containing sensor histidine kinase n=1 Tax=Sphingomonas sp. 1P06PA TaxID=554121 RepID=UPI0039A62C04